MRSTKNMSYTPRLLRVGEGVWTVPKKKKIIKNQFVAGDNLFVVERHQEVNVGRDSLVVFVVCQSM